MSESIKRFIIISVCIMISFFMSVSVIGAVGVNAQVVVGNASRQGNYVNTHNSSSTIYITDNDVRSTKVYSSGFYFSAVDGDGEVRTDYLNVVYSGYLEYTANGTYVTNHPNDEVYLNGDFILSGTTRYLETQYETYRKS